MLAEPHPTAYDLQFRVAGIPVRVHPAHWLLGLILGASAELHGPSILLVVGIVFVSVLVHELGHAFTMRFFGESPRVVLYWFGGLAIADGYRAAGARRKRNRESWEQVIISFAGPLAGFLLAGVVFGGVLLAGKHIVVAFGDPIPLPTFFPVLESYEARVAVMFLLFVNIYWGLLNLLPVYPLDGGQISRELFLMHDAWQGMERSLWVSLVTAGVMAAIGAYEQRWWLVFLFAMLAFSSWQILQRYTGRGGYGGPW